MPKKVIRNFDGWNDNSFGGKR